MYHILVYLTNVQCVVNCLGLRKKTVAPGSQGIEERIRSIHQTELFGQSDSIVKHVLEVGL